MAARRGRYVTSSLCCRSGQHNALVGASRRKSTSSRCCNGCMMSMVVRSLWTGRIPRSISANCAAHRRVERTTFFRYGRGQIRFGRDATRQECRGCTAHWSTSSFRASRRLRNPRRRARRPLSGGQRQRLACARAVKDAPISARRAPSASMRSEQLVQTGSSACNGPHQRGYAHDWPPSGC